MATGDRLTVQLEDGRGAQLRTLAGGERKVGAYLSDVIDWLWFNRDTLAGADIMQFAPMTPERQQEVEQRMEQHAQSLAQLGARQSAIEAQLAQLGYVPIAGVATPQ